MATIRPRRHDDFEALTEVLKAVHADSGYPVDGTANAAKFIRGNDTLQAWVAEINGRVVGHILVGPADQASPAVRLWQSQGRNGEVGVFNRLFVRPDCRGLGIARMLSNVAQAFGAENGLRLLLYVLEKDPGARRMYERAGWELIGDSDYEYGNKQSMRAYCFASPERTT